MARKTRVAVLMGGPSSEYEVSLKSGAAVLKYLDRKRFTAFPVIVGRNGSWPITIEELKKRADVAFIAMHGKYGEDGKIQDLLETFSVPYTGSGPIASALAMDKEKSGLIFTDNRILTPDFITLKKDEVYADWAVASKFRCPLVIKPADGGSSIGVSMVTSRRKLSEAVAKAGRHSESIIAQKFIKGREFSCGVLEINGVAMPLIPTEIIPKVSGFFDYYAKYNKSGSDEITPPNLPPKTIKEIQLAAMRSHESLGCSGMSRTDMILQRGGKIYVLETNSIPGLTATSLLPQQAAAMGIDFAKMLEIIISSAIKKHGK